MKWWSFLLDNNYFIYDTFEDTESVHLFVKSNPHACACPHCGMESRKLHASYVRTLQDTPIHGKATYLHANVFNYNCLNPTCFSHTFTESLPFAKPNQVRTEALNTFILGISIFLSNECASKILALLGVTISNDTIQSLYDRLVFVDDPDVEAIGVDDIAIRKGYSYATAIYDFYDHHLIALLKGREAESLKEWLRQHPKIHFVIRDRASAYAKAIKEVLPECIQVADRFHLLQNLLDHLKDLFKFELPNKCFFREGQLLEKELKKINIEKPPNDAYLSTLHYDNELPRYPDGTERPFDNKKRNLNSPQYQKQTKNRKNKQQLIRDIRASYEISNNKERQKLAHKFNVHPLTLKKYLQMSEEEIKQMDEPKNYKKRKTGMDNYLNMIFKMMPDGLSDDTNYYYLRKKGCVKKSTTVWNYIYVLSKNNFPDRQKMNPIHITERSYPTGPPLKGYTKTSERTNEVWVKSSIIMA